MGYPVASAESAIKKSAGQRVGAWALAAGVLYVAGYYLPVVDIGDRSRSFADGDSAAVWAWVVPGVVAAGAGVLALGGKRLAGHLAAGAALGLAGMTIFELLVVDELSSSSDVYSSAPSKAVGFWVLAAAAVLGLIAGLIAVAGRGSYGNEGRTGQGPLALLGGLCFVGVPLALLLPEDGFSPMSELPTSSLQGGLLAWAVVAPLIGFSMVTTRAAAGVMGGIGIAIAHGGFSLMMLQADSGSGLSDVSTVHSDLYHWTTWASLALLVAALAQTGKAPAAAGQATTGYTVTVQGQWAPDPYGRHQYRWYDGSRWTAQVSDSGLVSHDEPVSSPPPIPRDQWRPPHQ